MFLTLHIQMKALEIDNIIAFNERCAFAVKVDDNSFFQQVASRRFSVIRIIVEREPVENRSAYHCVDYTGASYVITEVKPTNDTAQALGPRIGLYADKYAVMLDYFPNKVDIDPATDCATEAGVRMLPKQEQNYHFFVKALVASYFTGK